MSIPVLSIQHLDVSFKNSSQEYALKDINFELFAGKTLALLGKSGSGKSVCSLAIMQLLPKTACISGHIFLNGKDLLADTKLMPAIRGKSISMVFQEPMSALNPVITCGNQLLESILIHQKIKDRKAAKLKAIAWLEKVQLPDPASLFTRYPHEISGGQKQRLMIAMAMCNEPMVLIADEPTTALDVIVQRDIIELMQALQRELHTAIIFITHDMALAKLIADDILVLENGTIAANQQILVAEKESVKHAMIEEVNTSVLSVRNISVLYKNVSSLFSNKHVQHLAVDNVSFDIKKGETVGLVGGSGCGKSTVSKCILGLTPVSAGSIFLNGIRIDNDHYKKMPDYRKTVQMIFQDPYASLNPRIAVMDMLKEVLLLHKIVDKRSVEKYMVDLLAKVELPASALSKYPHEFSGGQRQRLCIARALAVQPSLIICDESVAALDIQLQQQILKLLSDLQQELGMAYLFISHDLKIVAQLSNRILVMSAGKIVEHNDSLAILEAPQHPYTKSLIKAIV